MLTVDSLTILKKRASFGRVFTDRLLDTRLWFWPRSFWGSQQNSDFYPETQQKWKIKLLIIICLVLIPGLKGEKNETRKYPAPCQALYPKCFGSTWIVVLIELEFNRRHWKLQVRSPLGSCSMRLLGVWLLHQEIEIIGGCFFFQQKTDLKFLNSTTRVVIYCSFFCLIKVLPVMVEDFLFLELRKGVG